MMAEDALDSASSVPPPSAAEADASSAGGGSEPSPASEQKNTLLPKTGLPPLGFLKDPRTRTKGDFPSPPWPKAAGNLEERLCNRPWKQEVERTFSIDSGRSIEPDGKNGSLAVF